MGHERLGFLPKSRRWREIVRQFAHLYESDASASEIAKNTIRNVRSCFRGIENDRGVQEAFKFLLIIANSAASNDFATTASKYDIQLPQNPSLIAMAKALKEWVEPRQNSLEYAQLAVSSASDSLRIWYEENKGQQDLFASFGDSLRVWSKAGTEKAFCEISRVYFAKFVERYLNYFLEREASAHFPDFSQRDQFTADIRTCVDQASKHAFETAKITQSFAAGWYKKRAQSSIPGDAAIKGFLRIAFGKLRDELLVEEAQS
jgi:hypothetical protein